MLTAHSHRLVNTYIFLLCANNWNKTQKLQILCFVELLNFHRVYGDKPSSYMPNYQTKLIAKLQKSAPSAPPHYNERFILKLTSLMCMHLVHSALCQGMQTYNIFEDFLLYRRCSIQSLVILSLFLLWSLWILSPSLPRHSTLPFPVLQSQTHYNIHHGWFMVESKTPFFRSHHPYNLLIC